jgi:hypothetical protein
MKQPLPKASRAWRAAVLAALAVGAVLATVGAGVTARVGAALAAVGAAGVILSSILLLTRASRSTGTPLSAMLGLGSPTGKLASLVLAVSMTALILVSSSGYRGGHLDILFAALLLTVLGTGCWLSVIVWVAFIRWYRRAGAGSD